MKKHFPLQRVYVTDGFWLSLRHLVISGAILSRTGRVDHMAATDSSMLFFVPFLRYLRYISPLGIYFFMQLHYVFFFFYKLLAY